jgi:hypothetical protein
MSKKNDLQTIDPTALAQVSGGARTATSTNSADDATLAALSSIQDSLKSLANQNSGGFGNNEMLLLMVMLMNRNSQPTVVQTAPAGPPGGYWVVPR